MSLSHFLVKVVIIPLKCKVDHKDHYEYNFNQVDSVQSALLCLIISKSGDGFWYCENVVTQTTLSEHHSIVFTVDKDACKQQAKVGKS